MAAKKKEVEVKEEKNVTSKKSDSVKTKKVDNTKVVEEKKEKVEDKKRNYHISKRSEDNKWQVKFANGQKAIKLFDTQLEAIAYAKTLADNQEGSITIHKKDGKIRKQNYSKK